MHEHQFPNPRHDEACIKCGCFEGEPCEPPTGFGNPKYDKRSADNYSPVNILNESKMIHEQIKKETVSGFGITKDTQYDCVDWFSKLYLLAQEQERQLKIAKEALEKVKTAPCGNCGRGERETWSIAEEAISQLTI